IATATFLPFAGWAADRFDPRSTFVFAIAVFVASSIACAAAPTLGTLVLARSIQGAASALLMPVGRILVLRTVDRKDTVRAMAAFSMPMMLGGTLGPPVGGLIVDYLSWHWIFLLSIPLGAIGVASVLMFVPSLTPDSDRGFDLPGMALISLALAAFSIV